MKRHDLSWTIAICASLLLHGLLTDALVEKQIRDLKNQIPQPAFDLRAFLAQRDRIAAAPVLPEEDHPTIVTRAPKPELPKPPEFEELFGERGSKGEALNSTPGEQLMQAREGPQEQAALSRNPGMPGREMAAGAGGNPRQTNAGTSGSRPQQTAVATTGVPDETTAPFGFPLAPPPPQLPPKPFKAPTPPVIAIHVPGPNTATTKTAVAIHESPATRPVETAPATRPADVAMAAPTTSPVTDAATTRPVTVAAKEPHPANAPLGRLPTTQSEIAKLPTTFPTTRPVMAVASIDGVHLPLSPPTPASTSGGTPSQAGGGDPGNKSESESDPFSSAKVVLYRNGKVVARDGRKVKTVRPKLTEAGEIALLTMEQPMVVIGVHIDEAGKVVAVDTLRSSGSNDVDLPAYRAAWEWEFEPSKDASGNPRPDVVIIPFVWR